MEEILRSLLSEMRVQTEIQRGILEQVEDARMDAAKRNCPEKQKEMLESMRAMFAGSPILPMVEMMFQRMRIPGGKDGS